MNNFWRIDVARLKISLLLLTTFIYHTQGFHTLSQLATDSIVAFFVLVIFINEPIKLRVDRKILNIIMVGLVFGLLIFMAGLASVNLYDLRVAYRFIMPALIIWLGYGLLSRNKNPKTLALFGLRIYFICIVSLIVFNLLAFFLAFLGFEPLFSRSYGVEQVRTYDNYILASPSESDRFISHFGEPSDFVLVSTSGIMVALYFGMRRVAWLSLFLLTISFSGSLVVAWFVYAAALGFILPVVAVILCTIFIVQIDLQTIIDWSLSQESSGFRKFVQRFVDLQDGNISIGRIVTFDIYFQNLRPFPYVPSSSAVLNYVTNYLYYAFLRLGYLSLLFLVWFVHALVKYLSNVDHYLKYSLISLLLLSMVREAFATSLFFSYLVLMIYFAEVNNRFDDSRKQS